ncbi:MAG: hypothetical protein WCD23_05595 [Candidatus Acidiferrales bacterium]
MRRNAEGVGNAIEEGEHRGDVDGFGDLIFGPAGVAQFLDIGVRGPVGIYRDFLDVIEKRAFGWSEASFVELAFEDCRYAFVGGSLDTQEVGVGVQSIRTAIEEGDVTGDHFFVAAG